MNKIHRHGIDIKMVASAASKGVNPTSSLRVRGMVGVQKIIKRMLRYMVQCGLRIAKPLLRPVAFHLGRYIHHGLQLNNQAVLDRLERIEQYTIASVKRLAINCGQNEVLVKTEVGFVLCDAADHALLATLVDSGELELGTRRLIQRFLKPGGVFVDVGANVGMHTLAAAKAMDGQGKIIAFEPFEQSKKLLEKSMFINGYSNCVEINQCAVSNRSGIQDLYLGATSGHHSLFPLDGAETLTADTVKVQLVKLDEIIAVNQHVDLIKIDAEGAELDVLEGASALIENNPDIALIVELGLSHLNRTNHSLEAWLASFTKLGFDFRAIHPDSGLLEQVTVEGLERVDSINLFFAKHGSSAWV
jgi:FkbM family methyltransferase